MMTPEEKGQGRAQRAGEASQRPRDRDELTHQWNFLCFALQKGWHCAVVVSLLYVDTHWSAPCKVAAATVLAGLFIRMRDELKLMKR